MFQTTWCCTLLCQFVLWEILLEILLETLNNNVPGTMKLNMQHVWFQLLFRFLIQKFEKPIYKRIFHDQWYIYIYWLALFSYSFTCIDILCWLDISNEYRIFLYMQKKKRTKYLLLWWDIWIGTDCLDICNNFLPGYSNSFLLHRNRCGCHGNGWYCHRSVTKQHQRWRSCWEKVIAKWYQKHWCVWPVDFSWCIEMSKIFLSSFSWVTK